MFQNQLNVIRGVWRRLQSWQGIRTTPNTSLADASSDKLRILCETLLDVLLYTVYEIGPVPSVRIFNLNLSLNKITKNYNKLSLYYRFQYLYTTLLLLLRAKNFFIQFAWWHLPRDYNCTLWHFWLAWQVTNRGGASFWPALWSTSFLLPRRKFSPKTGN